MKSISTCNQVLVDLCNTIVSQGAILQVLNGGLIVLRVTEVLLDRTVDLQCILLEFMQAENGPQHKTPNSQWPN